MTDIDREYWKQISQMTGPKRLARSLTIYSDVREMLKRKIRQNRPQTSQRELNRQVALQFYRSDPKIQQALSALA